MLISRPRRGQMDMIYSRQNFRRYALLCSSSNASADFFVVVKTMAISAVLVANIFTGMNGTAWTAWLFFAVFVGIVIEWVFTVRGSVSPCRKSLTLLCPLGYIFSHCSWIRGHQTIWKRLFPLSFSLFLARITHYILPCARTSLPI
jgi:hypothetical protein